MENKFLAPRRCLLEPIPEIFTAADLLDAAVDAHLEGDQVTASDLIKQADIHAISEWTEAIWGSRSPEIHRLRETPDAPPFLPKGERLEARMPSAAEKRSLLERDGQHCRFCGIPVIDQKVRKAIREAYPEALRWGSRNVEQHSAFQCMWLQYDHILPHSRGGDNSIENIVVTCAACNFGRMDNTLEELGLMNPLMSPIRSSSWDGLERFLGS